MKKVLKIMVTVVCVFAVIVIGGIIYLSNGTQSGVNTEVGTIDLSQVQDGTYRGTYDSGRWTNTVDVTVENHQITEIKIVDDVVFVMEGLADDLYSEVIEKQNTDDIEITAGSTVTSKAYLRAICNAFEK
jgi:uncharacterized protein with FMN-binding domain